MIIEGTFREPSVWERAIIDRLFEAEFPGKSELKPIVADLEVRTIDEDGSIELRSSVEGMAPVVKRIPVECEARDIDGFTIHVLLHAVAGRPLELEIYKDDSSQVKLMPDAHSFKVIVLGR